MADIIVIISDAPDRETYLDTPYKGCEVKCFEYAHNAYFAGIDLARIRAWIVDANHPRFDEAMQDARSLRHAETLKDRLGLPPEKKKTHSAFPIIVVSRVEGLSISAEINFLNRGADASVPIGEFDDRPVKSERLKSILMIEMRQRPDQTPPRSPALKSCTP